MKTLLLVLLVTAVLWLLEALWLMLAIGAMHHDREWSPGSSNHVRVTGYSSRMNSR